MKKGKLAIVGIIGIFAIIMTTVLWDGLVGYNSDQNWQVRQSIGGNVTIHSTSGYYFQGFDTVWTYPRAITSYFSADAKEGGAEDDSIRATFNDSSRAQVSMGIRWQLPIADDARLKFHRDFGGDIVNAETALRAYLINVTKNTAPLMSASEHQSARKSEFDSLLHDQLLTGTYVTEKIQKQLLDRTDENGEPITVFATEFILGPDGKPKIGKTSPLNEYGIIIQQFNVTRTDYDEMTMAQFEAKKESFLAAERSKAQREEQVQERLMIEERGRKEKAEIEAIALKEKAEAVINAEKEKEVAETEAAKLLAVAELDKQTAETKAAKDLEVAKLNLQTANEDAQARRVLADAKKYELEQAGGLSDEKAAELQNNFDVAKVTAEHMSKINVPSSIMIFGDSASGPAGSSGSSSNGIDSFMFNMRMYNEAMGTHMNPVKADSGYLNSKAALGGATVK